MFTESEAPTWTSTVCEVLAGMISEILPVLALASSPLHPKLKSMRTPVAEAGLKQRGFTPSAPRFPISEGKVKRGRREGNDYCHRLDFSDKSVST